MRLNSQTANKTSGNGSRNEDSSPEILDEVDDFEADKKPKDSNLEKDTESQQLEEDEFLELEQSVCSESEKLCPSCKHIVPSALLADHIKECMQKFKLVRRRSERNSASTKSKAKEGDIEDDDDLKEVLPCPVFSKVK